MRLPHFKHLRFVTMFVTHLKSSVGLVVCYFPTWVTSKTIPRSETKASSVAFNSARVKTVPPSERRAMKILEPSLVSRSISHPSSARSRTDTCPLHPDNNPLPNNGGLFCLALYQSVIRERWWWNYGPQSTRRFTSTRLMACENWTAFATWKIANYFFGSRYEGNHDTW